MRRRRSCATTVEDLGRRKDVAGPALKAVEQQSDPFVKGRIDAAHVRQQVGLNKVAGTIDPGVQIIDGVGDGLQTIPPEACDGARHVQRRSHQQDLPTRAVGGNAGRIRAGVKRVANDMNATCRYPQTAP